MKKKKSRLSNLVENIIFIISIIMLVWFLLSFVDVNMNNNTWDEHNYSSWNIFAILFSQVLTSRNEYAIIKVSNEGGSYYEYDNDKKRISKKSRQIS